MTIANSNFMETSKSIFTNSEILEGSKFFSDNDFKHESKKMNMCQSINHALDLTMEMDEKSGKFFLSTHSIIIEIKI